MTTTSADDAWADPAWQVDSTLLACCGNIGHRHAPGCSAATPPTDPVDALLASSHTHARRAAQDLTDALAAIPGSAALLAVVDVVGARAHLLAAQRLLDRAAVVLTSEDVTG